MGIGLVFLFWATVGRILIAAYLSLRFCGKRQATVALLKKIMLL